MRTEQIVELGLKLTAILCLMYGFTHLGTYIGSFFVADFDRVDFLWFALLGPIIFPILASIVLFLMAKKWSTKIVSIENAEESISLSASEFQIAATSLLGTFFILTNIQPLISLSVRMYQISQNPGFQGYNFTHILPLLGYIVIIVIGVFLMFKASGLVGFIKKLRYAGSQSF